jgi:mannose/fructose/N-acetylgalactosamine-specific phosphotransferase system component IIB
MIAFTRVDNRLIHGQIIEVWLPFLDVKRILVADDEAAANPLMKAAMALAVPSSIVVEVKPLDRVDFAQVQAESERTLLLLRDVRGVLHAKELGLVLSTLNVGNVHYAPGRFQRSPSVFLSAREMKSLRSLEKSGVAIEIRAVPKDKPLTLAEIETAGST